MVIVCPKCQSHLKLAHWPCHQCKQMVDVAKNQVPGKPAVLCPHCQAQTPIIRLKCNKCQTVISMGGMVRVPTPPGGGAPAPASRPAAPRPAPQAAAPAIPVLAPAGTAEPTPAMAPLALPGDVPVFQKSPGMVFLLSLVTFGFYLLYWCPKAAEVVNAVTPGKKIGPIMAILAGLACCTPALIKFYWRSAVALGISRVLMVFLAFLPPVAAAVVQSSINSLYEGHE